MQIQPLPPTHLARTRRKFQEELQVLKAANDVAKMKVVVLLRGLEEYRENAGAGSNGTLFVHTIAQMSNTNVKMWLVERPVDADGARRMASQESKLQELFVENKKAEAAMVDRYEKGMALVQESAAQRLGEAVSQGDTDAFGDSFQEGMYRRYEGQHANKVGTLEQDDDFELEDDSADTEAEAALTTTLEQVLEKVLGKAGKREYLHKTSARRNTREYEKRIVDWDRTDTAMLVRAYGTVAEEGKKFMFNKQYILVSDYVSEKKKVFVDLQTESEAKLDRYKEYVYTQEEMEEAVTEDPKPSFDGTADENIAVKWKDELENLRLDVLGAEIVVKFARRRVRFCSAVVELVQTLRDSQQRQAGNNPRPQGTIEQWRNFLQSLILDIAAYKEYASAVRQAADLAADTAHLLEVRKSLSEQVMLCHGILESSLFARITPRLYAEMGRTNAFLFETFGPYGTWHKNKRDDMENVEMRSDESSDTKVSFLAFTGLTNSSRERVMPVPHPDFFYNLSSRSSSGAIEYWKETEGSEAWYRELFVAAEEFLSVRKDKVDSGAGYKSLSSNATNYAMIVATFVKETTITAPTGATTWINRDAYRELPRMLQERLRLGVEVTGLQPLALKQMRRKYGN